ncbi:hypothetical protein ACC685_38375, partial [Rhizobium ruizarguesonis]
TDALRAARAQIPTLRAADAGIVEIANCVLRGSPTVVKRVFAPTPRSEKAIQIKLNDYQCGLVLEDRCDYFVNQRTALVIV